MRKLKLDMDQLTVDSFDTLSADGAGRGTIEAFGTQAPCIIEWNPTYAPTCAPSSSTCPTNCEQESCGVYVCP